MYARALAVHAYVVDERSHGFAGLTSCTQGVTFSCNSQRSRSTLGAAARGHRSPRMAFVVVAAIAFLTLTARRIIVRYVDFSQFPCAPCRSLRPPGLTPPHSNSHVIAVSFSSLSQTVMRDSMQRAHIAYRTHCNSSRRGIRGHPDLFVLPGPSPRATMRDMADVGRIRGLCFAYRIRFRCSP